MDNCDRCPTPTSVELHPGKDDNNPEANIYISYAYTYVIEMMLYLLPNIRLYMTFDGHWCDQFTHDTKEQHDNAVKSICIYLQDTNYKGLVLIPTKIMVLDCYVGTYFEEL